MTLFFPDSDFHLSKLKPPGVQLTHLLQPCRLHCPSRLPRSDGVHAIPVPASAQLSPAICPTHLPVARWPGPPGPEPVPIVSSSGSSKLILVFRFSSIEDSRVSLTFVLTCGAQGLSTPWGHGTCRHSRPSLGLPPQSWTSAALCQPDTGASRCSHQGCWGAAAFCRPGGGSGLPWGPC